MSLAHILGDNVRALRSATQQSQTDLSKRCHIARSYLARIEKGTCNPSLDAIQRIASALNVDPVLLLLENGAGNARTPAEELARAAYEELSLVEWTSDGLHVHALRPKDDLSIRVLGHLIADGYRGDGLRRKYREVYFAIKAYFPDMTLID